MAKKYTSRKKRKKDQSSLGLYIIVIIPVTLLCILGTYLILQGVAERLGLSPVIYLGISTKSWMTSAEAVLMFIFWLSMSIVLGLIISYLLIRAAAR